jgi:polysaccharide export outer membrane protein
MLASSGNTLFAFWPMRHPRRSVTACGFAIVLFGLTIAQSPALSQADPARNGQASRPATESITLSPGDVVRITVWRKPELSGEFAIAGDGSIVHPLYRDVRVVGIPMDAVEGLLRGVIEKIERTPFVVEPLLRVSVEGEVRQPSVYSLRPETSIAQAIAMAGGPTERGRADKVRVVRMGGEVAVDLRRAEVGGSRLTVRSGDRIVVDRDRAVFRDILSPMITVLGATAAIVSVILYQGNR